MFKLTFSIIAIWNPHNNLIKYFLFPIIVPLSAHFLIYKLGKIAPTSLSCWDQQVNKKYIGTVPITC
jgi:hypothetical protein